VHINTKIDNWTGRAGYRFQLLLKVVGWLVGYWLLVGGWL
jgi:hypothetical protein